MATQCPCLPRVLRRRNARIAFLRIRGPPHTRGSCDFLGTPGTGLSKRFYVGIPFPGVSYIIKKVFSKYIPKPHLRVGCRVGAMRLQAGRMQSPGCRLQAAMAHSGHVQHGSAGCQAAGGKVQVEGWIGMRSARNIASHSFPVPRPPGEGKDVALPGPAVADAVVHRTGVQRFANSFVLNRQELRSQAPSGKAMHRCRTTIKESVDC